MNDPAVRPEYVKCISRKGRETYCGRPAMFDWLFVSLEHVENSERAGSRLLPCEECLAAARAERQKEVE